MMEIDVHRLRGRPLILALTGFVVSFAVAVAVGVALLLAAGGFASAPLLVAIILCATSLGLIVPVLKDSGQIAGAAVVELGDSTAVLARGYQILTRWSGGRNSLSPSFTSKAA